MWILLAIPAGYISLNYLTEKSSYGEFIHSSGDWSIAFLAIAMLVSPFRRHFPKVAWVRVLAYHRRALGVASFIYAVLHTAVYLDRKWGANLILKESQDPGLAIGWLSLIIFALLAITSNDKSVQLLKSNWKKIHRLVYPAALLAFAHWIITAFEPKTAYICLTLFVLLQVMRFLPRKKTPT